MYKLSRGITHLENVSRIGTLSSTTWEKSERRSGEFGRTPLFLVSLFQDFVLFFASDSRSFDVRLLLKHVR